MDKQSLEDAFYSKPFIYSYSSINKLLFNPKLFYSYYILGQKEDKVESYLVEGQLTHCLLLENTQFNNRYVVSPSVVPSENVKSIVDEVYKIYLNDYPNDEVTLRNELSEYDSEILSLMDEQDFYLKIIDKDKRVSKVTSTGTEYFNFLKEASGKILIDSNIYNKCLDNVELIKEDKCYKEYLGLSMDSDRDHVYNELALEYYDSDLDINLKGFVDNVSIDMKNKVIYINDLKTSSKTLSDFPDTVEYYNYWIQACIYYRLVVDHFKIEDDWTCKFTFIVIDAYGQVYPFEVSENTMVEWQIRFQDILHIVKYHYNNKEYKLPHKFLTSKILL